MGTDTGVAVGDGHLCVERSAVAGSTVVVYDGGLVVPARFAVGDIVRYCVGADGNFWKGRVCAREIYVDEHGVEDAYHVRWIRPSGEPSDSLSRVRSSELLPE